MLTRLRLHSSFRIAPKSLVPRPRLTSRYSTTTPPKMDQSNHPTRPKKLIFAPGDIAPEPSTPQHEHPSPSEVSTPTSTTEAQILSHPAQAHQFGTNPPLTISQLSPNPLHQFNTWFHDPRLLPSSAPETCVLATAELPSGRVSARTLYLKELDERGWVVYSNWGSRAGKGAQVFGAQVDQGQEPGGMPEPHEDGGLETEAAGGNKWGALTFTWAEVERCVRVEGLLEPLSREESLVYWQTRERGSKIGGWASWQSSVLWEARGEEIPTLRKDIELAQKGDGSAGVEAVDDADGRGVLEARVREVEERFRGVEEIPLPPFWGGMRLVPESVEFWQGRRSRLHDRFRFVKEGEGWKVQRLSP